MTCPHDPSTGGRVPRLTAILGCLALGMGGCDPSTTDSPESDAATKVRLQLNWVPEPQFGGIYEARRMGLFDTPELQAVVRPGAGGVSAPQLVATGEVEFSIVGGSQVLQLNAQGGDLVALFAVYQHDPHGIMVPADSPYQSIKELWDSPDAVIGAESALAFIKALDRSYSPADGARFVSYNLPAFRAGRQSATQCFVTAEPITLGLDGFETRVFLAAEASGFDPYNTVLVTRRSYLESNPKTCKAMVDAFTRGWAAYLANPSATNALLNDMNPAMSLEAMKQTAARQVPLIVDDATRRLGIGCMTSERWTDIAKRLVSMDLLDGIPDIDRLYSWPPAEAGAPIPAR